MATLSHLHTRCLFFVLLSSLAFVACEDDSSSSIGNQDAAAGGQQDASVDVAVKPDAAVDAPVTVDAVVDAAVDTVVDAANPCAVCSPNARCLVGGDAGGANTDAGGVCECNAGFEGNGLQCTAVAVSLSGLRWELPCAASTSANVCSVAGFTTKTTTMGGVPGALYALQLRFRGVVEQKTYTGGQADGYWYIGGASNGDAYNVYKLEISSPAQTYFLNAGASNIERSWALDYVRNIKVNAGATLTLSADAVDAAEIKNIDNTQAGVPLIIPGVAPAPEPYNGQFVQMDVLSVTRALNQ